MKSRNLKNKLNELNQKVLDKVSAEVSEVNPPKRLKQSNNDRYTDDGKGKASKKPIKEFNKLDKLDSKSHPMHRERSRTKQILNKFNVKIYDREDNSRARVKEEILVRIFMCEHSKKKVGYVLIDRFLPHLRRLGKSRKSPSSTQKVPEACIHNFQACPPSTT